MAATLRLKDPTTGLWYEVPALRGTTAYESAKMGGYTGTEDQFYKDLASVGVVGVHRYGIRWSKTLKTATRIYDSAEITTDTTNFCHRGSINESLNNPFDNLYPWKYRRVVNTDLNAYSKYLAGSPEVTTLESCILHEINDDGFVMDSQEIPVDVYTPEFWCSYKDHGTYIDLIVADGPLPGYLYFPETLGGRWFGRYNASEVPLSIAGVPTVNVSISTLHSKLKSANMTCDDAWTWVVDTILQYVEYACLNTQTNVGNGDSSSYRQSGEFCTADSSGTTISVPAAFAAAAVVGLQIDFGTSNGGNQTGRTYITGINTSDNTVTTADAVTVTTGTYISLHGMINEITSLQAGIGSDSGYIGKNGKSHAYYRGRVSHAGRWRYLLGLYRQGTTDTFWMAKSQDDADNSDALNTELHVSLGKGLPDAGNHSSGGGGYPKAMHFVEGLPFIALCSEIGGSSDAPYGDYCYWPASATGNTICIFGGGAHAGDFCGRSCFYWRDSSSSSYWNCAVLPFYKSRYRGGSGDTSPVAG